MGLDLARPRVHELPAPGEQTPERFSALAGQYVASSGRAAVPMQIVR